ncbi:MAG: multidrug effflux MFS transporter [Proteobacteria bacterium]|nr:multidrug effflux MFS transporter [Pseudomonadota bacterium]MBU1715488.1 multidrug effflux MFS transporter [Pseudomonadota bacterium]
MSPFRIALVLGVLSAIGPLAIDMYLPALPSIGQNLGTSVTAVQMSLLVYFLSLGIGQAIYGPLSDQIGRKPPMYFGLLLFIIGSIGCALAPDVLILIISRFVQGAGACAAMVIPRAIVRDLHTGNEAVKLMARLMLVFSVSPLLAPLAGSLLIELQGWRSVFWVITLLGLATLAMLSFRFPETRPLAGERKINLRKLFTTYGPLLKDRTFLQLVAIGALGISSFFLYLANSSFVMINHYGLTPIQYSIAFSLNAVAFIGSAQLADKLGKHFGLVTVLKTSLKGYSGVMSLLLVFYLFGLDRVELLIVMLFFGYGFLGLVVPISTVLALDGQGAVAGSASALMGAARFVTGAAIIGGIGLFSDGTPLIMLGGIAACAIIALVLATGPWGITQDSIRQV